VTIELPFVKKKEFRQWVMALRALRDDSLFLVEDASWTKKYNPGTLRSKRLALYTGMTV